MKKSLAVLWLFVLVFPARMWSQGTEVAPRHIIDFPTAGLLPRGGFDLQMRFSGDSGVIFGLNAGISEHFMFGVSYGGTNILGEKTANWNPAPGVLVKYQLWGESIGFPSVTIGFESQGYGAYVDSLKRFTNKSPGFYAVASKGYDLLEHLDFHGGINYSLENDDGDNDPNLFLGMTLAFNRDIEFLSEYDVAFNDSPEADRTIGDGNGYLNLGLRLTIEEVVYLELLLKNLFKNRTSAEDYNREFKITYFQFIL